MELAVRGGNFTITKLLFERKIPIENSLGLAILKNNFEITQLLLSPQNFKKGTRSIIERLFRSFNVKKGIPQMTSLDDLERGGQAGVGQAGGLFYLFFTFYSKC